MAIVGKLFGFEGRLRRRDWWLGHLAILVVSYLVWRAAAQLSGTTTAELTAANRTSLFGAGLYLAFLWPQLALDVKRLHDRDRTGWWLVAFYAPLRFWTFTTAAEPGRLDRMGWTSPLTLYLVAAFVVLVVELGLRDAAPGAERFGPPPKPPRPAPVEDPEEAFE